MARGFSTNSEFSLSNAKKIGKGQIILFSGEPNFRGSARGTNRLWLNAVIYGSGLGTNTLVTQ